MLQLSGSGDAVQNWPFVVLESVPSLVSMKRALIMLLTFLSAEVRVAISYIIEELITLFVS